MTRHRRALSALFAAVALTAAACGGGDGDTTAAPSPTDAGSPTGTELNVAPASFDLAVGDDQRFLAGLFTSDRNLILGGEVDMQFFYLGEQGATEATPEPVATTTGTFLPVPGKEPTGELTAPTTTSPADAAGVYETTVDFDRPGIWGVGITLTVDDEQLRGSATFPVADGHEVPAVGGSAPKVDNLTIDSDTPRSTIDSRAQGDNGQVPDPQLHDTTVATAIEQGRPAVVVVSTPTYCVSQFCGPITETIESLEAEYDDVAEFVHLEVWADFNASELNDAAAAWIQTEQGGNEPWVFFVGADGTVQARWDNVLDEAELVDILDGLAGQ